MNYKFWVFIQILLISLLSLASVGLGYSAEPLIKDTLNKVQGKYVQIDGCNNLSLENTAYCLRDNTREFYSYNLTQDIIKLSLEELKENGGDCKNWAEYYIDQASALGFNAMRPSILTGMKKAHTFAIISDDTGYCLIDQMVVDCHRIVEK